MREKSPHRKEEKRQLPEPYERALSSSLSLIEERLLEIENIVDNNLPKGNFFHIVTTISPEQRNAIHKYIAHIKQVLATLKKELNLPVDTITDRSLVNSRCASCWEIFCELEPQKLRRYGKEPEWLATFLKPKIEELRTSFENIVTLLKGK